MELERKNKKNICVITSTRAEYGLLYWLMKEIENSSLLNLKMVVTGTHLSKQYGDTQKLIQADGFKNYTAIPVLADGEGKKAVGLTAANTLNFFTEYFINEKPDAIVVLGDRFEILAMAQAAAISAVPVIHLHGGEITEGANDDMFRHAITKLSSFHFTSNREHRNRVIQLGEQPQRVKISGALGIENIKKLQLLNRAELENVLNVKFKEKIFLITFHPATLEKESVTSQFKEMINAISIFKNTSFVISKANADAGGSEINKLIDKFSKKNENVIASHSFGQLNYLSLMKLADAVIGNSSSGIIEAPSLYTPTVNIGSRQKGRARAASVIDCNPEKTSIVKAINKTLALRNRKMFKNPYDKGASSKKIVRAIEAINLAKLLPKKFHDL
jgi:GDP/UDP-N,N'-diacetylbacillosamine 2-epimerase (hydrolysing)